MIPNDYTYGSNFDIDTQANDLKMDNDLKLDYTRSNTNLLTQITQQSKKKSCFEHLKDIKQSFINWKQQYQGLTFMEGIVKFVYNVSHTGVTIATVIYCVVFIIVVGSLIWSNYTNNHVMNIEYLIITINCMIGIISLLLNIIPMVLIFDYILSCIGVGFTINASWRISDGYNNNQNENNSALLVFGLIMIIMIPFRLFWWHKYYPNSFIAMEFYTTLSQQGLLKHLDDDKSSESSVESEQDQHSDSMFY